MVKTVHHTHCQIWPPHSFSEIKVDIKEHNLYLGALKKKVPYIIPLIVALEMGVLCNFGHVLAKYDTYCWFKKRVGWKLGVSLFLKFSMEVLRL